MNNKKFDFEEEDDPTVFFVLLLVLVIFIICIAFIESYSNSFDDLSLMKTINI